MSKKEKTTIIKESGKTGKIIKYDQGNDWEKWERSSNRSLESFLDWEKLKPSENKDDKKKK